MGTETRVVRLDDPVVAPLLDGLAEEYRVRYGEIDEMSYAQAAEFESPDGAFVVVLEDGEVVAGGGFRRHDAETCEVKRMWTREDRRRRGLARGVLSALEDAARAAGYRRIILETGPAQPEAEAMYVALGYERIGFYGRYEEALAFERRLVAAS